LDFTPGLAGNWHPLPFLTTGIKVDSGRRADDFVFVSKTATSILLYWRFEDWKLIAYRFIRCFQERRAMGAAFLRP